LLSPNLFCLVADYQGELIAAQWVFLGGDKAFQMSGFSYEVKLGRNEAYMFNSYTCPKFRGQGIMNSVQTQLIAELQPLGIENLYTDILDTNETSIGLTEKMGLSRFEHAVFRRFLFWSFLKVEKFRDQIPHPVHLLTYQNGEAISWAENLDPKHFQLTSLKASHGLWGGFQDFLKLFRLLKKQKIELVHCSKDSVSAWLATRLAGVSYLTLGPETHPTNPVSKWLCYHAERLFMDSSNSSELARLNGKTSGKIFSIENRKLQDFDANLTLSNAKSELKLDEAASVVGTISPITPENSWPFIWMCESLIEHLPSCQFLYVGDGPVAFLIKSYLKERKITDRIRLINKSINRQTALNAIDVYVQMENVPAHSLLNLEARALGKPVLKFSPGSSQGVQALLADSASIDLLKSRSAREIPENFAQHHLVKQYEYFWHKLTGHQRVKISTDHWKKNDPLTTFSRQPR
jgi:hypothetical protein